MSFTDAQRASVVSRAVAQIGKPYRFGAAGPDAFDCSGLTRYAWSPYAALPHNSGEQLFANWCHLADARLHLPIGDGHYTVYVAYFLLPGDLVFYYGSLAHPDTITHVALYVGRDDASGAQQVVQATDEVHGVQRIGLSQYAHPLAYGFMGH